MVHLEIDHEDLPDCYKLLKIHVPEDKQLISDSVLPDNWQHDEPMTKNIGAA